MARDLIKHHLLPGLTGEQVIALVGDPDQVRAEDQRLVGKKLYTYSVGHWSFHGMDAAYVYVHLDADNRVVKAEVYGY